jgi:hypothetical protein
MEKAFKCDYCEAKPNIVYGSESLCNRHYDSLYGNKIIKTRQLIDVPKTKEEKVLKAYYMNILSNHNFVDDRKTQKILKRFYKDVSCIKRTNPIYHKE